MFTLNKQYSFSLEANPVIGPKIQEATLVGIVSYATANKIKDVDSIHAQIYPYLPAGTPRNNKNYTYYHFTVKGEDIVIANYWVVESSISEVENVTRTINLSNISESKLKVLRNQLNLLGITFDID